MGRKIPDDNPSIVHQILYLSFAAAGLVASFAIIAGLCSNLFRKKTSPPPTLETAKESNDSNSNANMASPDMSENAKLVDKSTLLDSSETPPMELPLPPALQQPKESNLRGNFKRATSERKPTMNMSIKLPKSVSMARNKEHRDDGRKKMKFKAEDSVWMKTIILGEKCVPDEEQDAVIYEGKGKRISAYHPKSCMSVSRQTSFIDPGALPHTQS